MADAIGSVRATFTASAGGLLGAINQSVSAFGSFAASAKRTAAQQGDFQAKMSVLSAGLADGSTSVEEFATSYARLQTRFKGAVTESDRIAAGLEALRGSQAAASMSADEYAAAEARVVAEAKAATPALEKLKNELAANKADFMAGKLSVEEYRDNIARLPGAIGGAESDQQAFNRVLQETRGILAGQEAPTAKYERQLETLDDALRRGIIDDQQYAAATQQVRDAMTAADPAAKALAAAMERGKAVTQANLTATEKYDEELAELRTLLSQGAISQETFARASKKAEDTLRDADKSSKDFANGMSSLPGPLGSAARALNSFGGGLQNVIRGFSGGAVAGLRNMFSGVGEGLSNAFSSGGASLAGIAPQLAVIGTIAAGTVAAIVRLTGALAAVGSEVERTQQLASRLGVSFQDYEVLAVAANNAGVDVESLAGAQTKFLKAVSGARDGTKAQVEAFAALGVSQEEVNNTNPNTLLEQVAQKLNAIEDPATRAALTMKLFGKTGNDVLPALAAIDATREGIARLGGTMSQVDVQRFSQLDDAFDNVGVAGSRLGKVLLTPFTELFARVSNGLAAVTGGLAKAFAPLGGLLAEVGGAIGLIVERLGESLGASLRVVGALLQLSGVTSLAAAIGAAVDQLSGAFAGVDSFVELIVSGLEQVAAFVSDNILRGVTAVFTIFGNVVSSVVEWVSQSGLLAPLIEGAAAAASFVADAFRSVGGWVSYVVQQLEYWAGIEPPRTTSPEDKEAIEAQMKAREEAEKAEADAAKKAEARAKTIREGLLSPYEKMLSQLSELNDLESRGLLNAGERAAAESKIRDEFAKQDPLAQAAVKYADEQRKASADIAREIEKAATAGKELGAAGQASRDQFVAAASEIKDKLDNGLIDPEEARKQMSEAADAMNEELKRVGDDLKLAEKIRDSLKTDGQKVAEELKAIDENKSLTAEEKDAAKAKVREKAADSLPGKGEETLADKFSKDQKKLQDAFDNGVIDSDELERRTSELKKKLTESLPGKAQQDASDKFREGQEQLRDALDAGIIDPDTFKERMGNLRSELEDATADARDKQERNSDVDRRANQAVSVNSSEGASTFFRLLRGQDDPTKKQLKELEKQTRLLAKVADDLADTEVVDI